MTAAPPPLSGAPAPLDGVRVLEIGDESVEYCGRLLAGLGADVVRLEPPEGSPSRRAGPFLDDEPGPDRSLAFWADNVGKRSVVATDAGCLMNIAGCLRRRGSKVRALHLAQVLEQT